jgi:hypothetical protein
MNIYSNSRPTRNRRARNPHKSFFYNGRTLCAVIEPVSTGWVVLDPKGSKLGIFPTREFALSFINARIARPPAAPVAGERETDAKRVRAIRNRQRHIASPAYRGRSSGIRPRWNPVEGHRPVRPPVKTALSVRG